MAGGSGRNQTYWDGRDERGALVSGLVLVQVTATTEEGGQARGTRLLPLVR